MDARGLPPLLQLPARMPPAPHWRAVRALFALAEAGFAGAFAATFLTAVPCGVLDRWFWLPPPLDLPMALLGAGFALSLGVTVKPRYTIALVLGAFAGEFLGLLLPGVAPPVPGADPVGTALRLSLMVACGGGLGGLGLNLAYARLRPSLDRRFATGFPFAAIGAVSAGLLAIGLLDRDVTPFQSFVSVGLSVGLGLLAVGVPINTSWLYAHGFELLHTPSRRALAICVAVLVALLVAMRLDPLHIGLPTHLLLIACALLATTVRLPLRTSAPLTGATFVATIVQIVAFAPADAVADWRGDTHAAIAMQLGFLFTMSTVYMQSAAFTARLLFEQRLHRYARQLEVAEADHRRVSASAVREGLSQSLVGVRFALSALNSVGLPPSARRSLDDTLALLRAAERDADLAHRELGPVGLEERGIAAVLEAYLAKLAQDGTTELELVATGPLDSLSLNTRRLAFRIVADLVGSAVRTGASRRMRVAVEATPAELFLVVRDDGAALAAEPDPLAHGSTSRLALLRERVVLEGGDLRLAAANDDATEIRVTLPLRRA